MAGFLDRLKGRKADPHAELKRILGEFQLPAFSGVVVEVLRVLRDPNATSARIAEVMAADPRLSIDVLRMANSAYAGAAREIESLGQAVSMLGHSAVESLVLTIGVRDALPTPNVTGFDRVRFWTAAARRATVAQAFAGYLHPASQMESFTASLLQDLAVPVLARQKGEKYGAVLQAWHHGDGELATLEQSEFGWDHTEVGGWLCNGWGLPERLAAAVGTHHIDHPEIGADCPPAVALVGFLRETEDKPGVDELVAQAREWYGIPEQESIDLLKSSEERIEALLRMFV
ncbi:MAG TPA: hypothetical protein DIU15_15055 [Deltaproteobacteria bacterium]|nr:hypothetical protein [Deltaproteobacteria bacterium]HCP47359.1 hypothetical protein [Deltaproteobacteria bacterium]